MRVLILTLGSRGDVQPYVALGVELRARGHEVTVAASIDVRDAIEEVGLGYGEIALDFRAITVRPETQAATRSVRGLVAALRDGGELVDVSFHGSWTAARACNPDVIVYHPKMLGAPHVAEKLGVPALLAAVVPAMSPTEAYPNPLVPVRDLGPILNRATHRLVLAAAARGYAGRVGRFREEVLGLSLRRARTDLFRIAGRPVTRLVGVSRAIVPEPERRPPGPTFFTGYWFTEPEANWTPPAGLARFLNDGPPPVYVGFGSMAPDEQDARAETAVIVETLRVESLRGVLASGWGGLATGGALPPHVHGLVAAPHSWLFPRCAAVIHHGGAGTTHEGLRWGRPTAIRPFFGDQPFWARRVEAIGAGIRIHGGRSRERLSEDAMRGTLRVLGRSDVREAADRIGRTMRSEPGTAGAAEVIEQAGRA